MTHNGGILEVRMYEETVIKKPRRIEVIVCCQCDGTDLTFGASAFWDVNKQKYVVDDPFYNNTWCDNCNDTVDVDVIIEERYD